MGWVRVRDPWTTLAYLRNYVSNNFRADVARACNGRYAKDELVADCRLYVSVYVLIVWGPIYQIFYDLSYNYRTCIVRSTYDSDLKRAEISLRNIVSQFTNIISDDITILHVNLTYEKLSIHCNMLCTLDVCRKLIVTLALS